MGGGEFRLGRGEMDLYRFRTPIGEMTAALDGSGALKELSFRGRETVAGAPVRETRAGAEVERQLVEYFAGRRTEFALALDPDGTPFQKEVWKALLGIPYGQRRSYSEIARRVGKPDAVRAVGAANGANPIAIVIPCHRVVGKDGSLTGYGGGLPVKRYLLDLESGQPRLPGIAPRRR